MSEVLRPDLCVIGAGSGGLSVAAAAALFGTPVVLIEKDRMGGDCLNVGCVPSKALIAAAAHARSMRDAVAFGVMCEPRVDFVRVHDHIHRVIAAIAPNDSEERFTALGVTVIRAAARFTDRKTVVAGDATIQARRFVLATGSRPSAPPIEGLDRVRYLTNETIFDLTVRPERLVVIGAGPIGLELAQAFRRLGSEVVVLDAGQALGREDPEMASAALAVLEAEGVDIRAGVRIARVERADDGVRVILGGPGADAEMVDGTHLLVATGRKAVVDGLGLTAARVRTDERGIVVGRGLRTRNRRIYAIGDCIGGPHGGYQFTHAANHHAGLVIRNALFRLPVRLDNGAIPRVTYTDPEIAAAGLSEAEARKSHRSINVLRWPFAENDRAQTERRTLGHIKVVTTTSGRVLGAAIVGAHAGELIAPWAIAVAKKLKATDIASVVLPYPTLSEVSRRAALSYLAPSAAKPWVRSLIGFLRKFG